MTFKENVETVVSYLFRSEKRELIKIARQFKSKVGLEIGGPSSFFSLRSYMPIYLFAEKIDGVNFSNNTVWEGSISEGENFEYYNGRKGYQYISEASDLSRIESGKYDFILSCHCLEHTANPLKALKEWSRVLKNGGELILILPDKNFTFDKFRPVTTFKHLEEDFQMDIDEADTTHFSEVINFHDLQKDQGVETEQQLIERTNNNYTNRCVHHHVFDFDLIRQMLEHVRLSVQLQQWAHPFHMVSIAKKAV
jgi:SAM-dependent methyltransferase